MSEELEHPACLVTECTEERDKGFAATKEYVSNFVTGEGNKERIVGSGYGWSLTSQSEADQLALDRALEQIDVKWKVRLKVLNALCGFFGIGRLGIRSPELPLVNERLIMPKPGIDPEGIVPMKPWEYRVTVAIPHIDTIEALKVCVEVLRWQTIKPYIMIIDTGSPKHVQAELEKMRDVDLEIHYIRGHSYQHSSEPVTAALDLAHTLCRTEYLFHTHSDCFLQRRDFLEDYIKLCSESHPVVGYKMSPRDWVTTEWEWMVGHTVTLLHMPTMNRVGAMWSMQRMHSEFGYAWRSGESGWPDTEVGFNNVLKKHNIHPIFIGEDRNHERHVDRNLDHARSYPGAKLYAAGTAYAENNARWIKDAMEKALWRIHEWRTGYSKI